MQFILKIKTKNMKTIKISAILILLVLVTSNIFAQNRIALGVNAGLTAPVGTLGDNFKLSYNAGVEGVLKVDPVNHFYADISYNNLSPSFPNPDNLSFSITEMSIGYRRVLSTFGVASSLFGDLGAGAYTVKASTTSASGVTSSESKTNFGINLGVGTSFPLGTSSDFLARLKFHNVFTDGKNSSYIVLGAGVNFDLN